jgi:hypothetical protein
MKIVLIEQYYSSSPGSQLDVPKPIADLLLKRKIAKRMKRAKK